MRVSTKQALSFIVAATIVGLTIFLPSSSVSAISVPDNISKSTDAQAVNIYLNPDLYNFSKSTDLTKESVNSLSGYEDGSLVVINTRKISGEAGSWMTAGSGGKGIARITLGRDSGSGGAEYVVGFYKPVELTVSLTNSTAQVGQVEVSSTTKVWKVYSKISDAQIGYGIQDAQYSQLAAYPTVQYRIKVNYFSVIDLTFKGVSGTGSYNATVINQIIGILYNTTAKVLKLENDVSSVKIDVEGLSSKVSNLEKSIANNQQNVALYPNATIYLLKNSPFTFVVNTNIIGSNSIMTVGTETVQMIPYVLDPQNFAYSTYTPKQTGTFTVTFSGSKSSWSMMVIVV